MIRYFIEEYTDIPLLIRNRENHLIERYDRNLGEWVYDVEMLQIYTGDIPVRGATEKEIESEIGRLSQAAV